MGSPVLQFGKPEKALLGLAVASLALSLLQSLSPSLLPLLQFALALLLILGGLVVTHRLIGIAQWAARKLLWRVRHRMVAVFFFVGVLPISLGGLLVIWGILLLLGPLTAYMITTQFTSYGERLQATAGPLLWQLQELPASARPDALARFHASASKSFPGLAIRADFDGATQTYPEGALTGPMPSQLLTHPAMVRMENGLFLPAVAHDGASGSRLVLAVPVTAQLVHEMMPGLGVLAVEFDSEAGDSSKPPRGGFQPVVRGGGMLADNGLPAPRNPFDWQIAWPIETLLLDWRTDKLDSAVYLLRTRPSALWGTIFAQESERTFGLFSILGYCLMAAFGANLLISLFVAISLTRTLTRALNDLYVGTTHVNRGDFSYRIPVSGNDQVSDLSRSFNAMTGSIKRLIEDSKQRQQLEAELEIAREVQARLFPANPPQLAGLEVLGVCRPARSVSGDFFDYVQLNDDLLALSFGDVSGKGISAALVMATLHSIVRTQLSLLHPEGPQTIEEGSGPARGARQPAALRRDRSREVLDPVLRRIRSTERYAGLFERGTPAAAAAAERRNHGARGQRPDRRRSSACDLFRDDDPAPARRHAGRFHGRGHGA